MFQNIETKNPLQIKQYIYILDAPKIYNQCKIQKVHRRLSKSYGFCELYAHISIYFILISVFFSSISLNLFFKN